MSAKEEITYLEKQFGERIKLLRQWAGYKFQKDFAKVFTGSDKKTTLLSRIENGANLEFRTILKLAQSLNISLVSIFDINNKFPVSRGKGFNISFETLQQRELKSLGQRIKKIRKTKGIAQLDVDVIASIDRSNLSNYEQGLENITFDTIAIIADALNIELWELFK